MRLYVFGCRPYDEEAIFRRLALEYHLEIGLTPAQLTKDNMEYYIPMLRGYDAVSVVATPIHFELLEAMHEAGVRLLSTRTIGYDHIDMAAAKALGFTVCNAGYGPDAVADYTVMLMLMALRNAKRVIQRADLHDFSMPGLMGRQLRSCTVGILGAGRIGARVMEELRGFGCRVIYWNRTSRPGLAGAQALPVWLPQCKPHRQAFEPPYLRRPAKPAVCVRAELGPLPWKANCKNVPLLI